MIPSFGGAAVSRDLPPPTRSVDDVQIQLERPEDRPAFAEQVARVLVGRDPALARRLVTVADIEGAAPEERRRFYEAAPVRADESRGRRDRPAAGRARRRHVGRWIAPRHSPRCAGRRSGPGEVLVAQGSPPAFVYVPTGPGLVVLPDGGYAPSPLHAWVPVGTTGVIRRAERNSEIVAERAVDVIVIPGELYAREWLRPLSVDELLARLPPRLAPV